MSKTKNNYKDKSLPGDIILSQVEEIPPLSVIALRVIRMLENEETSASSLVDTISVDQALTADILKLCNSAYYGLPRTVYSVVQAVMYLGFNVVKNLALTLSLRESFNQARTCLGYEPGGMWKHAIATAIICEHLAENLGEINKDTAFTMGLLHDIGKLAIIRHGQEWIPQLDDILTDDGVSNLVKEQEILGYNHAELGARISEQWNFPVMLYQAFRYHHNPETAGSVALMAVIVNLGDVVANRLGIGRTFVNPAYPVSPFALGMTRMDEHKINELCKNIKEEIHTSPRFSLLQGEGIIQKRNP